MIRINRQTDYAVRVLLALAKRDPGQILSTAHIQHEMLIPPALAHRIVADLARGGFILTYPGRDGGLALSRPPADINLREVVEQFEGPLEISDCLTGDFDCPFDRKCPVRCQWISLQSLLAAELEKITFAHLVEEAMAMEASGTSASVPPVNAAEQDRERSGKTGTGSKAAGFASKLSLNLGD
jgi:Rrf2 family protein